MGLLLGGCFSTKKILVIMILHSIHVFSYEYVFLEFHSAQFHFNFWTTVYMLCIKHPHRQNNSNSRCFIITIFQQSQKLLCPINVEWTQGDSSIRQPRWQVVGSQRGLISGAHEQNRYDDVPKRAIYPEPNSTEAVRSAASAELRGETTHRFLDQGVSIPGCLPFAPELRGR